MKKSLLAALFLVLLLAAWLLYRQRSAPPEVAFARVSRGTLTSTVVTNGVVEPVEWAAAAAERAGVVRRLLVKRGATVRAGQVIAELDTEEAKADLNSAEARSEQARAELQLLEQGGRASDRAALAGEIAAARADLEAARSERDSVARLAGKQAAPRQELVEAERRVERVRIQLAELEKRMAALVDASDRAAAAARLRESESAAGRVKLALERAVVRAPIAGVVYQTDVHEGDAVQPGQVLARVGRTDRMRVRVYVDEPELGRVAVGMPVSITWDALQNRRWEGKVERMPSEISALGSRQVGEVACVVGNPGGELLPGANVNVEIRSSEAPGALSVPREALRQEDGAAGVFLLRDGRLEWRKVELGISSVTRVQVTAGLEEGDAVALPGDTALAPGAAVRPVFR
ncbi:MAG: efflux RND transporter periplasmic adaptor subunit [Bryobacterales bacterium]|nr:efflux RND transporter periplasmic adaptor subunit [Bryobacterales bacterium]